jgi:hypothetical protein
MNNDLVLFRLRRFLLMLAGVLFMGTLVELVFTNHTKEIVQLIPFGLGGLGAIVVIVVLAHPQRIILLASRMAMGLIALGSLFGVYEHVASNIDFHLEIYPRSTWLEALAAGLGGANPLVAPGILAVAAVLVLAATFAHPGLKRFSERGKTETR